MMRDREGIARSEANEAWFCTTVLHREYIIPGGVRFCVVLSTEAVCGAVRWETGIYLGTAFTSQLAGPMWRLARAEHFPRSGPLWWWVELSCE